MINMSYCRYENTLAALYECYRESRMELSDDATDYEKRAYKELIELCRKIGMENSDE